MQTLFHGLERCSLHTIIVIVDRIDRSITRLSNQKTEESMKRTTEFSIAVLLLALLSSSTTAATSSSKTWTLHHAVFVDADPAPVFVPRGRIRFLNDDSDELKVTLENEEQALTTDLAESLSNDHAWYQLKLVSDDDDTNSEPVLATVPACQVRRANFR